MIGPASGRVPNPGEEPPQVSEDVVGIVHDLRLPLSVISGYADLLDHGELGELPARAQTAVAAIAVKAAEMRALLEAMLDLDRDDSASDAARRIRSVNLVTAAKEAVERAESRARLGGDELRLVTAHPRVPARADPRLLGRILDNLVNNALSYARHPGRVAVSVAHSGGFGEVRIEDDGSGVPETVREQLLRSDDRVEGNGGAGLGLRLCFALAERIGGTLRIDDAEGGGALFILELPLAG